MAEVSGEDVEEDEENGRISSREVVYEPQHAVIDQLSVSASGTPSEDWLFQRRLFLNFEVLNPKQHKVDERPRLIAEIHACNVVQTDLYIAIWFTALAIPFES